jgi:hypothetical protein
MQFFHAVIISEQWVMGLWLLQSTYTCVRYHSDAPCLPGVWLTACWRRRVRSWFGPVAITEQYPAARCCCSLICKVVWAIEYYIVLWLGKKVALWPPKRVSTAGPSQGLLFFDGQSPPGASWPIRPKKSWPNAPRAGRALQTWRVAARLTGSLYSPRG